MVKTQSASFAFGGICALLCASGAHASQTIRVDQPYPVNADRILISTHSTATWDCHASSRPGLDQAVASVKSLGGQVYYLTHLDSLDNAQDSGYFWGDTDPTGYVLPSSQGEHMLTLQAKQVYWTGGYFESCSSSSVSRVLLDLAKAPGSISEFDYVMDGLYTGCPDLAHIAVTSPDAQFSEDCDVTISLSECLENKVPAGDRLAFIGTYLTQVIPLRIQEEWNGIDTTDGDVHSFYPILPPVADFTFDVWFKGQRLGSVGGGAIPLRVNFLDSADIY